MEKILIVDDSVTQAAKLKSILEDEYEVTVAQTAIEGLSFASTGKFSLILLDVVMPEMDGFVLLKKLQEELVTEHIPVILITSLSDVQNEQKGLIIGAVDYITKPFSMAVLVMKIGAVLKRSKETSRKIYANGGLVYDFENKTLKNRGQEIELTALEIKLLEIFLDHRGIVLTRERLLDRIWDMQEKYVEDRTLSVNIHRLREKIEDDSEKPNHIRTVFGIGYKWEDE